MAASLITTLLALAVTTVRAQGLGDVCRTPRGATGLCVPLSHCPPLVSLLHSRPSPLQLTMLHRSRCGFDGSEPIVCCPRSGTTRPVITTTVPSVGPGDGQLLRPRDVRQHPNLRLLPLDKCGPSGGDRIFGGEETEVNEFPWMVRLGYTSARIGSSTPSWKCGGSLISSNYVLTAAHCVVTPGYTLVKIRVGEHNTATDPDCSVKQGFCNEPYQDFDIEQVLAHPKYSKALYRNDIALVRLLGRVYIDGDLRPICLPVGPAQQAKNLDDQKLVVAGWGTTEAGTSSTILLKVEVPVQPLAVCKPVYEAQVELGPTQLCAGGVQGKDSCTGDSGGPLMLGDTGKNIQHGVVSFGPRQCGTEGRPGVYTRVGFFMDWILDNMRP